MLFRFSPGLTDPFGLVGMFGFPIPQNPIPSNQELYNADLTKRIDVAERAELGVHVPFALERRNEGERHTTIGPTPRTSEVPSRHGTTHRLGWGYSPVPQPVPVPLVAGRIQGQPEPLACVNRCK